MNKAIAPHGLRHGFLGAATVLPFVSTLVTILTVQVRERGER